MVGALITIVQLFSSVSVVYTLHHEFNIPLWASLIAGTGICYLFFKLPDIYKWIESNE